MTPTPSQSQASDAAQELPSSADVERFYMHLEQVLQDIKFLRPHQGETMARLRHLTSRAEPNQLELNILRGILSAVDRNKKNGEDG